MKKKTKESSYFAIINDLSKDIGISKEETKSFATTLADLRMSTQIPLLGRDYPRLAKKGANLSRKESD